MKTFTTGLLIMTLLGVAGCVKEEDSTPHVGLHVAALQGNTDQIRKHIQAGSNLDEIDAYGSTPLIIAITFGRTDAARALIEASADLTIPNKEGSTPLHIAAFLCRTGIVEALLENGADKSRKNGFGATALEIVEGSFEKSRPVYDRIRKALRPLGLKLDYDRIERTRPRIAEMLR